MTKTLNIPKTFMLYAQKGDRCGYVRFTCRPVDADGGRSFTYVPHLVKEAKASSLFVNFDNTRNIAVKCIETCALDDVSIIDSSTGKRFHVKGTKQTQG